MREMAHISRLPLPTAFLPSRLCLGLSVFAALTFATDTASNSRSPAARIGAPTHAAARTFFRAANSRGARPRSVGPWTDYPPPISAPIGFFVIQAIVP